jgi:hypothetical protein
MATIRYKMGHLLLRVSDAEANCFRPPNKHSLCNSSRIRLCVSRRVADPALGGLHPFERRLLQSSRITLDG